jgi:2-methylcitrate dehydratase PrpD
MDGIKEFDNSVRLNQRDPDILAALAEFAVGVRLDQVPEEVRRQASWCLLDTVGCMVAGTASPEALRLRDVEASLSNRLESSVFGWEGKLSMHGAARVNAYMGDILELNDLIGGHASVACVPVMLALAQSKGKSGACLLEAIIVAIEVTARVYTAFYPALKPYTSVGMNPSGIPSTMGCAAGAARLMGLDQQGTQHALAIAGALAGWCPAEVIFGSGGTIKPMLFGSWPASVGLMAAQYACAGLDGPARLLESPLGYYATAATKFDRAAAVDPADWYLKTPSRKLHACCSYIHSAIETLAALRKEGALNERVRHIRIGMAPYVSEGVSKSGRPESPNEARFHAQYLLALSACSEDVIRPEHSENFADYISNTHVVSMMDAIQVVPDTSFSHYYQCSVSLLNEYGNPAVERLGLAPKGSPRNALGRDDIREKFQRLASGLFKGKDIAAYMDRVESIDGFEDWSWLYADFL